MAKRKSNRYAKKAKKSGFMGKITASMPTKGNIKNTALETGKDLLVGVIGGGLIGAAIGKPSLLVGTALTGVGHYTENRLATLFGIGIMASNGFQKRGVSGLEGMEGVKERLQAYRESFAEKLYVDKLVKKGAATNGVGELQYFNYAADMGELNALDSIERQIEESGMQHLHIGGGIAGVEGVGLADAADYNF